MLRGFGKSCVLAVAVALAALATEPEAKADGLFFADQLTFSRYREKAYIHEPEQKAAIIWRNGVEDLIISPRFSAPSERFAWVVPTPSRPTVAKVSGAIFHELAKLAVPYVPKTPGTERAKQAAGVGEVSLLERKTVGAYDVAVLQANDPHALMRWLKANKFVVPPAAEGPMRQLIQERWTFVAMRVRVAEAARGLREGTLAPVRLTFRTAKPVYPLRLSAALPSPFDVVVYLIVPCREAEQPARSWTVLSLWGRDLSIYRAWSGVISQAQAPTLASLIPGRVAIYPYRWTWEPAKCRNDLTFITR